MEFEYSIGDFVKIRTLKDETQGTILENSDNEIILLKLKSGYNIGIRKENITDLEIIKKVDKLKEERLEIKEKKGLPYVDIIITGGTISSRLDPSTGAVKWLTSPQTLFKFYPEIFDIVNVKNIKVPFMKASENMDFKDWQEIAKNAEESLNDKDVSGVIITHGTDFLHYTASALSFFLRDLNKPVVLTYAQRSSDRASSDASLNLQCAARAAISEIAEVMLVGHATMNDDFCYAMSGTKVRKMHSSRRDAFKSINAKPFAKIWPDKIELLSQFNRRDNMKKVKIDSVFEEKVALLKFYPGMDPEIFDFIGSRYKGLILEVAALGHVAIDESRKNLLPVLKKAIDNGLIICASPQTIYGRLDPLVYSPGRKLMKTGIIFLEDMLSETAYVKLGWVLGHKTWVKEGKIKDMMLKNFSKEINDRLEE